MPHFTEEVSLAAGNYGDEVLNVKWGDFQKSVRFGILESGFLWDGMHWDTVGLYQYSSLNTPEALQRVNHFRPQVSAKELIKSLDVPPSKFRQPDEQIEWDGIVLALQNPTDRSIMMGAHERDYFAFVHAACKKYGKRLFLKLHPWNRNEKADVFRDIANEYGCGVGHVDHSVLDKAEFCLLYNSTFAFDCFVRGVPVVQYAPGYFWQTGAVFYTERQLPDTRPAHWIDMIGTGHKLADFCVWNYMIHCKMSSEEWVQWLKHIYDNRDKVFPIAGSEWSWAHQMLK